MGDFKSAIKCNLTKTLTARRFVNYQQLPTGAAIIRITLFKFWIARIVVIKSASFNRFFPAQIPSHHHRITDSGRLSLIFMTDSKSSGQSLTKKIFQLGL